MTDRIEIDRRGHVAVITLARAEKRNAVDPAMSRELAAKLAALDGTEGVRAIVLTGAGEVFCAGADLHAFAAGGLREMLDQPGGFCGLGELRRRTPLIAAVNGHALAGGCELALACDLIVADAGAEFGLPEVTRGIIAGAGGVFRLARAIPVKHAMEIVLTGRRISAAQAFELGLVNRLAPHGTALDVALELARAVAENAPSAVRESRALVELAAEADAEALWRATGEAWARIVDSPDAREGAVAFAERRAPAWTGS